MFLTYQRASRPYKRLVFKDFTFLYFQCFVTTDMFCFVNPHFFVGIAAVFRDLAFGSVKTRFKTILKKLFFFGPDRLVHELLPLEGD